MVLKAINTVCTLAALVISTSTILLQLKNYRKPMDQRLVVRILLLVPLFAISSWTALYAPKIALVVVPIREIYEAFTIYTFFTLLTTMLGGERDIIFTATGRRPQPIVWPLGLITGNIDISDPPTFLLIKRAIMQYVWVRPLVALFGYVLGSRAALPLALIYNVSITIALNALTIFWICLRVDLAPYRPWPKFLSVKLIVFFSYWQALGLAILHWLGVVNSSELLATISNTLLCIETLGFALFHQRAFPHTDYATTALIGFGRLPVLHAARDVFGIGDLVQDFKSTFLNAQYGYRDFDSVEAVLDHPESMSRANRLAAGLRYHNGGRSKYWLPVNAPKNVKQAYAQSNYSSLLPAQVVEPSDVIDDADLAALAGSADSVASEEDGPSMDWSRDDLAGDEELYTQAKKTFGDYNCPVVTVRESTAYRTVLERQGRPEQQTEQTRLL